MKLAIDVYYYPDNKKYRVAGVLFKDWCSIDAEQISAITYFSAKELPPYIPGKFKDRELPCILKLFNRKFSLDQVDTIIIDGYVLLGKERRYIDTLGIALHQELCKLGHSSIDIIGVAKTKYHDNSMMDYCIPVYRGEATTQLYISSLGISCEKAAENIKNMYGKTKIPKLLKLVDDTTKEKL
jgi:deoxyribonuclease V